MTRQTKRAITLKGRSLTVLVLTSMNHVTNVGLCHQVERVAVYQQGDVAVIFLKQSLQTVKGTGYHQHCYQRFCDKARYFFSESETLTWNEFVNFLCVTVG